MVALNPNEKVWYAYDIKGTPLARYDAKVEKWIRKEDEPENQIETVVFLTPEDAAGGKLAIDPVEGEKFYNAILKAYLDSGVNDDYFKKNFGFDTKAPDALDQLLVKLRGNNYVMSEGLISLKHVSGENGELKAMPEFRVDTIEISILLTDEYNKRRLSNDPNSNIKNTDVIYMCRGGEWVYGFRSFTGKDGKTRLNLIHASIGNPEYGVASLDLTKQESMANINQWLNFFPFILKNMKNYRNVTGKDYLLLNVSSYFWNQLAGLKSDGTYNRNSTSPEAAPVIVASNQ